MIDEICRDRAVRQARQRDPHPLDGKWRAQPRDLGQLECVEKWREAGQHETHVGPERSQRRGQRRHHVAQAAGLDPGVQLGRHMQDTHRRGRLGLWTPGGIGRAGKTFGSHIPQRRFP